MVPTTTSAGDRNNREETAAPIFRDESGANSGGGIMHMPMSVTATLTAATDDDEGAENCNSSSLCSLCEFEMNQKEEANRKRQQE